MPRIIVTATVVAVMIVGLCGPAATRDQNAFPYSAFKGDTPNTLGVLPMEAIADPVIDWPLFYGVQQTGVIDATFDCFGMFGRPPGNWSDVVPEWPQAAFVTPSGSGVEYLFAGAIWIGGIIGSDTLVSVGAEGWLLTQDFSPTSGRSRSDHGTVTKFDSKTDYSMRAEFTDTLRYSAAYPFLGQHKPLSLLVANRSHVWRTAPYNSTIIYDMVITNIGKEPIEKGCVGLLWDVDVCFNCQSGGFVDDLAGSLHDKGIGYVIDNDGDLIEGPPVPKLFACKYLSTSFAAADTTFNWWVSNGNPALDFGPRQKGTPERPFRPFLEGNLGTPVYLEEKYYIMSFKEWDYDQIFTASIRQDDPIWMFPDGGLTFDLSDGYDTRFLLSIGPFDLKPDSSVRVMYATFTADSVHTQTDNLRHLPGDPEAYLANLGFAGVLANAARSDSLVDSLLDPYEPVIGLHLVYGGGDSAVIQWDPWVFPDVAGNEIYASEVPLASLPYPGVAAPWLRPENLVLHESIPATYRYAFKDLEPGTLYFVNVANRTASGTGDAGKPIYVRPGGRASAPPIVKEFIFSPALPTENREATIAWSELTGVDVDHYSVYKFADSAAERRKYHAFYDEGAKAEMFVPKDTFEVDGTTYYYYALVPVASVDSGVTSWSDVEIEDGNVYVVAAVDKDGFESEFSDPVTVHLLPARDRDILVLTNSAPSGPGFVNPGAIDAFYSQVLAGYNWDEYDVDDSTGMSGDCPSSGGVCVDWRDLMRYRLVIIDDHLRDLLWTSSYEDTLRGLTRYLLSGGCVAYFGQFNGWTGNLYYGNDSLRALGSPGVGRFFGVDSVHSIPLLFYNQHPEHNLVDSLFGFIGAEPLSDDYPGLDFDSSRHPYSSVFIDRTWHNGTAPAAASFKVNPHGEVTHLYRSLYPASSLLDGDAVGVRTETEGTVTYLFGFHLWYMDASDARALVDVVMADAQTAVDGPETGPLPTAFSLNQNYPNPFNMATRITFSVPRRSEVTLEIFNILGQRVRTLMHEVRSAGSHAVAWDGADNRGRPLASGVYLYRLTDGQTSRTRKMVLLK